MTREAPQSGELLGATFGLSHAVRQTGLRGLLEPSQLFLQLLVLAVPHSLVSVLCHCLDPIPYGPGKGVQSVILYAP
jgi:hypothetical protein